MIEYEIRQGARNFKDLISKTHMQSCGAAVRLLTPDLLPKPFNDAEQLQRLLNV
jgi:hypothetical protein